MDREDQIEPEKTRWKHLSVELQHRCLSLSGSEGVVGISHAVKMSTWASDSVVTWLINKNMSLVKAVKGGKFAVCQGLLDAGARADDNTSQALHLAAAAGREEMCQLLLSQPNNPARADAADSLALIKAAEGGYLGVCKLLLSQPGNPARADAQNNEALIKAAYCGHLEVCKLLLSQSNPARADAEDSLALLSAANYGHLEVCKLLLSQPDNP